eukprot:6915246-Ditylum_brightwellii.AAC.1
MKTQHTTIPTQLSITQNAINKPKSEQQSPTLQQYMAASAIKMKYTLPTYAAPNNTTRPPQSQSTTLEEESMDLYIWVTASIDANNDIF